MCECPNVRMSKCAQIVKSVKVPRGISYPLLHFFKFGENIFRSSARGECPACEIFNFEFLYLAEASAGNAPRAKLLISKSYGSVPFASVLKCARGKKV